MNTSYLASAQSPCTLRSTLLQSPVAQRSPLLPETRPSSLEASPARSPAILRHIQLCDSTCYHISCIPEFTADGLPSGLVSVILQLTVTGVISGAHSEAHSTTQHLLEEDCSHLCTRQPPHTSCVYVLNFEIHTCPLLANCLNTSITQNPIHNHTAPSNNRDTGTSPTKVKQDSLKSYPGATRSFRYSLSIGLLIDHLTITLRATPPGLPSGQHFET